MRAIYPCNYEKSDGKLHTQEVGVALCGSYVVNEVFYVHLTANTLIFPSSVLFQINYLLSFRRSSSFKES